jgi:hypothetical protein
MCSLIKTLLPAALILSTMMLGSCKKNEEDQEETSSNTETLPSPNMSWTASTGEVSFSADTTSYSYAFDESLGLHVLSASDDAGRVLTFMMANVDPGTYEVDFDSTIVIWTVGTNIYNGGFNPQGEIIITENANNRIRGTFEATLFSFTTASEVTLSNGAFNRLAVSN